LWRSVFASLTWLINEHTRLDLQLNKMARSQDIFDFFGLPRELRDFIYDHLLTGEAFRNKGVPGVFRITARRLPLLNLQLLNQQFREEYLQRAKKAKEVTLDDLQGEASAGARFEMPAGFKDAPKILLNLALCAPEEVHDHVKLVERVSQQMPELSSMTIVLVVVPEEPLEVYKEQLARVQTSFTSCKELDSIAMHTHDFASQPTSGWDYTAVSNAIMKWDAVSGELKELPTVKAPDGSVEGNAASEADVAEGVEE